MQNTTEVEPSDSYAPYVSVKDRNAKAHLCHIAKLFQYIDRGLAKYFQAVVLRLPQSMVEAYLESARNKRTKRQAQNQH